MRKILDAYDYLIETRLVAVADAGALLFLLPWVGCLIFNRDLLSEVTVLGRMGRHLPQTAWAAVGAVLVVAIVRGLLLRKRHPEDVRRHRSARLHALLGMGGFYAWVVVELAAQSAGRPALWWNLLAAAWCVFGAARLKRLIRQQDVERSRF